MKRAGAWAVLGCLVLASPVSAGDGGQLAADQLPPDVVSEIRDFFGAEPLHARMEVEGDRACYVVTARRNGKVIEIYASPNGTAFVRKTEAFSLVQLAGATLLILVPGIVVGAAARGIVRAAWYLPLPVPIGWPATWATVGAGMAFLAFNLATARHKDGPVIAAYCVLWAASTASLIEVICTIARRHLSGDSRRRWLVRCCVVMAVSLLLTIPLDILRIVRENYLAKQMVLRPRLVGSEQG